MQQDIRQGQVGDDEGDDGSRAQTLRAHFSRCEGQQGKVWVRAEGSLVAKPDYYYSCRYPTLFKFKLK